MTCCVESKKSIFYEIKMGNLHCLCENISEVLEDVKAHLEEENSDALTVKIVRMTQEEYNSLPEFEGW